MAPKAGKRKREPEGETQWTQKSLQELEACFSKELSLFLKASYVDIEHWNHRKFLYFQRNYAEVPRLLDRCKAVIESINEQADERISKILSDGPREWDRLLDQDDILSPFLLSEPEQHKGFLRFARPRMSLQFGVKDPQKQLPSELSHKIERALHEWWYSDVRHWVVNAERDLSSAKFSQLLWGSAADHMEVKVVGSPARSAVHFLLPDSASLETLALLADEHIIMKWQERNGREDEYYGSWLLEVIDGHRKRQIDDVIRELQDVKCPMTADPEKLKKVQELERSIFQYNGWMRRHMFQELIDLKVQCQGMTEQRGLCLKRKIKKFCPYKRFASCNEELEHDDEEEYLAEPYLRTLPAPEDQQLLAHMEPLRETEVTVKLSWIKLWDCELRVEVLARVPKDYKRPYHLVRVKPESRASASPWSSDAEV